MVLRQWGGSSHLEPPTLVAATNSKNTAGAGRIFHLGTKCFQTLFSGLKGEVPALKATDTRVGFTVVGPVREGGVRRPTCQPSNPSPPLLWAGSGPSLPRAPGGGLRLAARAADTGPRRQLGVWGSRAAGAERAAKTPPVAAPKARASAFGWCARARLRPALPARARQVRSPPPPAARTGWIQLTPLPRAAAAAAAAAAAGAE